MSFRRVVQSYLPANVNQLRVCAFLLYISIMLSCFEFHPEITLCAVRKMRETVICDYLSQNITCTCECLCEFF